MNRPSIQDTLISIAFTVAERATCDRQHCGCVIATDKGVILSSGYNGAIAGAEHCNHECDCNANHYFDLGKPISHSNSCPTNINNSCTKSVHAEANAIFFAARSGVKTEGAYMYCTTAPCLNCAKAIIQSGIKAIWYKDLYRGIEGIDLLKSRIEVHQYEA